MSYSTDLDIDDAILMFMLMRRVKRKMEIKKRKGDGRCVIFLKREKKYDGGKNTVRTTIWSRKCC